MANSYFKFKQFTIHQHKCAMKVCTDACLFGAVVAQEKLNDLACLDIGTGTGLLSLMLAQKNAAIYIDAVEIDANSAEQALENIMGSPWAANIQVHHADILNFSPGKQYDRIISNPPFFEDDLLSTNEAKNKAKHDTALNLMQLLNCVDTHLTKEGMLAVLLPYQRVNYFIEAAEKTGLHLSRQMLVKQTMKHKFFRGILFFERKKSVPIYNELIIKDTAQNYTPEFAALLKDYYLFL